LFAVVDNPVYKDLSERDLAAYCRERDRMAENELYRRYAARVLSLCRRYINDDEEAKDMMQESIVRAVGRIGTFTYKGTGSLASWLDRIAVNMSVDHIRRKSRLQVVPLDFWMHDDIPEPTGEEMAAVPEEKLLEWIDRLPDLQRSVFNLYCIDDYTHREIGEMLGITEKGSASILSKARKKLKEDIRRYQKEHGK
jgi:RNA polymerase sigma-70 factor (ECF subfamily)